MWAIKPDPGTNCLLHVTQEEYLMLMGVWLKAGPQCLSGGTGTVINSLQVLVTSIILPKLILPHMCMMTSRQERREVWVFFYGGLSVLCLEQCVIWCTCIGHCWPGALQDNHHSVLQGSHGFYSHVWHHQRGVFQCRPRLVRDPSISVSLSLSLPPPCDCSHS